MGILAFIGFAFLVWWASRKLRAFGNFLCDLSEICARQRTYQNDPRIRAQNKKAAECIEALKGEQSDVEYNAQVREEIERLTS